eukprot:6192575-Alexandrium_andersonii.AAC.1
MASLQAQAGLASQPPGLPRPAATAVPPLPSSSALTSTTAAGAGPSGPDAPAATTAPGGAETQSGANSGTNSGGHDYNRPWSQWGWG